MYETVKAAAVNFLPWKWHKDWNACRLEEFVVSAAEAGAKIVVAPEGILEGYVSNEAICFAELREAMLDAAEPIGGPYVAGLRRLARRLKVCLVFGMAERVGRRDIYNTAVFLDHRGRVCGTYHKTRLAEGYDKTWFFNRIGKDIRAVDTPLGRCGMLICNDRWEPRIARALVLDGARFLCIPSFGNRRKEQDRAVQARARENGVPIVEANVGVNLIISKGEIVACDRRCDTISLAEIDIPAAPSARAARTIERAYLISRPALMARNLKAARKGWAGKRKTDPYRGRPPVRAATPSRSAITPPDHERLSVNDRPGGAAPVVKTPPAPRRGNPAPAPARRADCSLWRRR